MLLYKNQRFYFEGVSFAIPDGYYLDTNYGDGAENSLDFWTNDMSLRIRIAIEQETKGPLKELNSVVQDLEDCVVLEGPDAILQKGLAGYSAIYDTGRRQYCEMRYAVSDTGNNQSELMVLFVGDPKLPSKKALLDLVGMIDPRKE